MRSCLGFLLALVTLAALPALAQGVTGGGRTSISALAALFQLQRPGGFQRPSSPTASSNLVFNLWIQKSRTGFAPEKTLNPKRPYYLHAHVSSVAYGGVGVTSPPLSKAFVAEIETWLRDVDFFSLEVKVILLADPDYITIPESERSQTLTIDLNRIRRAFLAPHANAPNAAPIVRLKELADPEFVFGRIVFPITTTNKTGRADLGLVFWMDGARPVDELSVPVCVAVDKRTETLCGKPSGGSVLKGVDSFRLMTTKPITRYPDAALQFFELETNSLIGVWRQNNWAENRYQTWKLYGGPQDLSRYFWQTLDDKLNQDLPGGKGLIDGGFGLYNLLFPPPDASAGRKSFSDYLKPRLESPPFSRAQQESIFVRIATKAPLTTPLPFTLLNITPNSDPQKLLGFHFRIEQPLSRQDYQKYDGCISNWVALMPGASAPALLTDARGIFQPEPAWKLIETIPEFQQWIGQDGIDPTPTAIFTLSHHSVDTLFFTDDGPTLTSTSLVRQYPAPSIAVLNGCGTKGNVGPFNFLNTLNRLGIGAAIVTNTEVDATMAGEFYSCFFEAIKGAPEGEGITIGAAYSEALACLNKKTAADGTPLWGPAVLSYTLIGNAGLKLCYPK